MKGKAKSRPKQPKSSGTLVGMVIMLICAIILTVYGGGVLRENGTPLAMLAIFYLFMAAWIATALYLVAYNLRKQNRP